MVWVYQVEMVEKGGSQGSTSESGDRFATDGGEGSSSEGANGGRGAVNAEGSGRQSSSGGGGGGGGWCKARVKVG